MSADLDRAHIAHLFLSEHERMIQSTQRKMLRLIIQTKRKYKKIEKQVIEYTIEEGNDDKTENCSTDDKSGDDHQI